MSRPSLLLLSALMLAGCSGLRNLAPHERRAVVVTLDGGAVQVIDKMMAAGAMPNLARLKARGAWPTYSRTNYPSKTAAGHAALWTGAYSDVNGVTCNKVFKLPLYAHSILEVEDGFDNTALFAEPLWVTAARAGKRVMVLQATHGTPISAWEPGGRFGGPFKGSLTLLDGFDGVLGKDGLVRGAMGWAPARGWNEPAPGAALERRMTIGGRVWWAVAYDDPQDPVVGFDTIGLAPNKAAPLVPVKPGGWTPGLPVDVDGGRAWQQFHLYALDPQLNDWLLYHSPLTRALSNKAEAPGFWYGAEGPFMPQGPGRLWATGELGRTMFDGGDGSAEDKYLAVVARLTGNAGKRLARLTARHDWDLGVYYLPFPDEALHHWYGGIDDPKVAPRVWEKLTAMCRLVDGALAPLVADPTTTVAIAADHGMAPTRQAFAPNYVLKKAGLLVLDKAGKPDLKRTRALYPATDGAFVVLNKQGRKGGIVSAGEAPRVLAAVVAAFRAVKTPTGQPLVTNFVWGGTPEALELGIGGPRAGDLYLDLAPGYYFDATVNAKQLTTPLDAGRAGHVFDPRRPDMHAFMGFSGPGVKQGVAIGAVRHTDFAPTICRILGIPAPAQATGRVLTEALTDEPGGS